MSNAARAVRQWTERSNAPALLLADNQSMFRLLFEHSADATSLFDPQTGRLEESNEAVARLLGAPGKEALVNVSPAEASPERQPDGRLSREKAEEMTRLALANGSHRFEWLGRRYDGTELPLDIVLTAVPCRERPLLLVVARDISRQKQIEKDMLELNASLEKRVAERTAELLQANDQLKTEIGERRRQVKIQSALFQISEAVHAVDDLNSLYARIHSIVKTLMPADNFYLALTDAAAETVSFAYWANEFAEEPPEPRPALAGRTGEVLRTGKPLLAAGRPARSVAAAGETGVAEDTDMAFAVFHRPTAIWLGAPLLSQGRAFGVMAVGDYRHESAYGENEKQFLAFIADQTALAILRKRAEQELRVRSESVQKHRDVLLELAQSDKSDFNRAVQHICARAATALEVARVSYWSLVEDDSAIVCRLLHRRDLAGVDPAAEGARLAVTDCPAYFEALATQRPIIASRARQHPATRDLTDGYLNPLGISSMLDAPVWVRGKVVGVLCHEHTGPPRDWAAEEIDFVSALATMVSLALEEANRARSDLRLRESEEKFRALFEASSQGVILHDEEQMFEVNPACLRILGFQHANEVIGKHPAQMSAPIQPGCESADVLIRKHIRDCITRGCTRFDWLAQNSRGETVPIEVILTRIPWGGRPLIQAVFNDITERKRAEAELLKALARERELGQLRSSFVSMVSHEFRTPLGIIQSSAEILEDYFEQLAPEERKEHLRSIRNNTRRMAGLMEEALLIGQFEAGKIKFKAAPMDLRGFATRLVDEVQSATNRRCPIEWVPAELPAQAELDEGMLRHIFTNLLVNAVKYSDPGRPVRFEMRADGAGIVSTIRDRGIGIPAADQQWLFNAFHRGRNVGERSGTGLGLVIVKRCVDLLGGRIKVESKPGEGTTVTVRLPQLNGKTRAANELSGT